MALKLVDDETVEVVDDKLWLVVPGVAMCESGPMSDVVTDTGLCQAPNDANKCTTGDLVGVYVEDPENQCDVDVSITTNSEINA